MSDRITKTERTIIAGLGSTVPLAISFLTTDYRVVFSDIDPVVVAGYAMRIVVLFALGAMAGWINRNIQNRRTLFQLGISAPAVFAGYIASVNAPPPDETLKSPLPHYQEAMLTTPVAYVSKQPEPLFTPAPAKPTPEREELESIFGGMDSKAEKAEKEIERYRKAKEDERREARAPRNNGLPAATATFAPSKIPDKDLIRTACTQQSTTSKHGMPFNPITTWVKQPIEPMETKNASKQFNVGFFGKPIGA